MGMDQHHRDNRRTGHAVSNAADHGSTEGAAPVCTDHDQVNGVPGGDPRDHFVRLTDLDHRPDMLRLVGQDCRHVVQVARRLIHCMPHHRVQAVPVAAHHGAKWDRIRHHAQHDDGGRAGRQRADEGQAHGGEVGAVERHKNPQVDVRVGHGAPPCKG